VKKLVLAVNKGKREIEDLVDTKVRKVRKVRKVTGVLRVLRVRRVRRVLLVKYPRNGLMKHEITLKQTINGIDLLVSMQQLLLLCKFIYPKINNLE
jgi:hypothetical protein